MKKNGQVRLVDVAERCGLSYAAVSHILSRNPNYKFKKATIDRVLQTARKMNYRPNQFAASLRKQENRIILCIVGDALRHADAEHLKQLEFELGKRGYNLVVQVLIDQPDEVKLDFITRMINFPAGIAIWSVGLKRAENQKKLIEIFDNAPPTIALSQSFPGSKIDYIQIQWGERMLKILFDLFNRKGFERVGVCILHSESKLPFVMDFLWLARNAGMQADVFMPCKSLGRLRQYEEGWAIVRRLLKCKKMPQALYCTSDEIAFSVIEGLREHGIRVPQDIYIVGGGDSEFARYYPTPLPVMIHDIPLLMKMAADDLIERIERGDTFVGNGRCIGEVPRRIYNP